MESTSNWQQSNMQAFWREIAPCSHVVQIYEDEKVFLNLLEGFVAGGITVGESAIVIATPAHRQALDARLSSHGLDVAALTARNQYIALDAQETLNKFMVNDWPDYNLFMTAMTEVFELAHDKSRKVRAFGEMVVVLWEQGKSGATIMLEHLWNIFCERDHFTLFCAYPQHSFSHDAQAAVKNICGAHSQIVNSWGNSKTEIAFRTIK